MSYLVLAQSYKVNTISIHRGQVRELSLKEFISLQKVTESVPAGIKVQTQAA